MAEVEGSIISKITMATIGCTPGLVKNAKPEDLTKEGDLPLARLYGKLTKAKVEEDKAKGTFYTVFVGTFEAINMQTGEVFQSGRMFLPKGISEMVEGAISKAPEGSQIAFAFEVRSQKANNPIGYSYKVLALQNPEASDELKELRDRVYKAGAIDIKRLTGSQKGKTDVIEGGTGAAHTAQAGARKSA